MSAASSPVSVPFTQAKFEKLSPSVQNIFINYPAIMDASEKLAYVGAGAVVARFFTSISALGGAICVASCVAADCVVNWICSKINRGPDSQNVKIAKRAIPLIASLGAGYAALALGGFPVTITSVVILYVGSTCLAEGALAVGMTMVLPFVPQRDNNGRQIEFRKF
jgi:hypothetical protein